VQGELQGEREQAVAAAGIVVELVTAVLVSRGLGRPAGFSCKNLDQTAAITVFVPWGRLGTTRYAARMSSRPHTATVRPHNGTAGTQKVCDRSHIRRFQTVFSPLTWYSCSELT
jgi:hypothetical protein